MLAFKEYTVQGKTCTHVYELPLSKRTTALFAGEPGTVLDTSYVSEPTMNPSRRTFHRVGFFVGNVGIATVLFTAV